jgi:hypothetical protein
LTGAQKVNRIEQRAGYETRNVENGNMARDENDLIADGDANGRDRFVIQFQGEQAETIRELISELSTVDEDVIGHMLNNGMISSMQRTTATQHEHQGGTNIACWPTPLRGGAFDLNCIDLDFPA